MQNLPDTMPTKHALVRTRRAVAGASLALLAVALLGTPAAYGSVKVEDLPERYQQWLEEVALLIDDEETAAFLELEEDYQRDAFIERFWKARDPDPDTERNGVRDGWYTRLDIATERYGNWTEDRARVLLLNGEPAQEEKLSCQEMVYPLEVWDYPWSERAKRQARLLFYNRVGKPRLWIPNDGYVALFKEPPHVLVQRCQRSELSRPHGGPAVARRHGFDPPSPIPDDDFLRGHGRGDLSYQCAMKLLLELCGLEKGPTAVDAVTAMEREEEAGGNAEIFLARLQSRPEPERPEWLATFAAHSTDLPADADLLDGDVAVRFAGRHQSRTVMDVEIQVPREEATPAALGEHSSFDFVLTGEVLREAELFESFRYSFSIPEAEAPETLPLVFRRHLRPGEYSLVMKLEDVHGGRFFRREEDVTVPKEPPPGAGWDVDTGEEEWALDAVGVLAGDDSDLTLELTGADEGVLVGSVRFEAAVHADDVDKLTFFLDGKPLLSRSRPPYTVELNLGEVPRPHSVRAAAYARDGSVIATDELDINAGENRFHLDIVDPRSGSAVSGQVPVRIEVDTPEGTAVERLEIYRGDTRVATLHQPPFVQRVPIPEGPGFLRAVAYLPDGSVAEDTVILNVEGSLEEVNVELVELYATVLDPEGHAVSGLTARDFRVREDGEPQSIVRFEPVSDRPVNVGIVVDASSSMEDHLPRVRQAATGFLNSFMEPQDRAALVVFNDRPRLLEKLTGDADAVAQALASFGAEGNTALWDSVVFALHHLGGIEGQRALLVLTDGKDESSRFDFEQALAYARAMGTTIYTIGIGTDLVTRRHLAQLSEESGGRSFRVDSSYELDEIYQVIARELRAGYLVVYQSPRSDGDRSFRQVEASLDRPGYEVRTIRGYYP